MDVGVASCLAAGLLLLIIADLNVLASFSSGSGPFSLPLSEPPISRLSAPGSCRVSPSVRLSRRASLAGRIVWSGSTTGVQSFSR